MHARIFSLFFDMGFLSTRKRHTDALTCIEHLGTHGKCF